MLYLSEPIAHLKQLGFQLLLYAAAHVHLLLKHHYFVLELRVLPLEVVLFGLLVLNALL